MLTESSTQLVNASAPSLKAKLAPWMKDLLQKPAKIRQWIDAYGSPCHLVNKSEFDRNIGDLLSPFKSRGLKGSLFFARKANKLACFVSAAKEVGIGVDTASLNELRETLSLGLAPDKVVFTAIGKDASMIRETI